MHSAPFKQCHKGLVDPVLVTFLLSHVQHSIPVVSLENLQRLHRIPNVSNEGIGKYVLTYSFIEVLEV